MQDRRLQEREARALLRFLRDLNLGSCGIEVSSRERVELGGCLSLDGPVERGVRYLLRREDGRNEVLDLRLEDDRLRLHLRPAEDAAARQAREIEVRLVADPLGRVSIPGLGARFDLRNPVPRDLEHFLRRLVRAACTRAA